VGAVSELASEPMSQGDEVALAGTAHLFWHDESWLLRADEGSYLRMRPEALPDGAHLRRTESVTFLSPVDDDLAASLHKRLPAPAGQRLPAVRVEGSGVLADLLRAALGPRVAVAAADVVVSLSDGAPPASWDQREDELWAERTPWHRAHIEAGVAHVGPLTRWGTTAGHRDVLRRRRAAAPDHAVLDSFLASLPDSQPISLALRYLVVGLLLADLDRQPGSADLRLVRATGVVQTCPVLPWPEGLHEHAIQ
jgi:hypothetical protein